MRTTVLLPVDLHATLKTIADRDRRSLHQEIIFALEQFAAGQGQTPPSTTPITGQGGGQASMFADEAINRPE